MKHYNSLLAHIADGVTLGDVEIAKPASEDQRLTSFLQNATTLKPSFSFVADEWNQKLPRSI